MNGNSFFDFSGPLGFGTWDEAMLLSPNSWPTDPTTTTATSHLGTVPQPIYHLPIGQRSSGPLVAPAPSTPRASYQAISERAAQQPDPASTSPFSHEGPQNREDDGDLLVNTFLQMLMPPILTPVEIGAFNYLDFSQSTVDVNTVIRAKVGFYSSILWNNGSRITSCSKCDHGFRGHANATEWDRRRGCENGLEAAVRCRCQTIVERTCKETQG